MSIELRDSDLNPLNPHPKKCQNRYFNCNDRNRHWERACLCPPKKSHHSFFPVHEAFYFLKCHTWSSNYSCLCNFNVWSLWNASKMTPNHPSVLWTIITTSDWDHAGRLRRHARTLEEAFRWMTESMRHKNYENAKKAVTHCLACRLPWWMGQLLLLSLLGDRFSTQCFDS